jgi:hypothetical protein
MERGSPSSCPLVTPMKLEKSLLPLLPLLCALCLVTLPACDDGPAESAGEKVDEAVKDAGRAIEDATD